MPFLYRLIVVFLAVSQLSISAQAEDWLQFRGPDATSLSPNSDPPVEFSSASNKNVAWKSELPGRSAGGAIVIGDQVVVTSSQGLDQRRIYITSISAESGKKLWQQVFVARGRPFSHPYSSNAAPTPASDGQRIFAFYSSNDLVCLDLAGQLIWYRSLATEFPKAGNDTGMSSSPLVVDGVVVLQIECQGDSFAAGVDSQNGELLWRVDRPRKANWSSPAPLTLADGSKLVVLTSSKDVTGFVARTGKIAFKHEKGAAGIPSALGWNGKLLIASDGLTVLDCSTADGVPKKLWGNNKLEPGNSSPIVVDDAVVLVKGGVLSVGDLTDGTLRYKLRLPDAGSIWSTPVVCGNRLYVFSDKGRCFVVQLGKTSAEIIATNEIDDTILGSPAVSNNALFVRGDRALWKIVQN